MATIIVKPEKDNSKNRRYRQRGELMAKRREDAAFTKKISKAWAKLTKVELPIQKPVYSGSCCLPEVAKFATGYRKSEKITAR